jgi:hypothetical protein
MRSGQHVRAIGPACACDRASMCVRSAPRAYLKSSAYARDRVRVRMKRPPHAHAIVPGDARSPCRMRTRSAPIAILGRTACLPSRVRMPPLPGLDAHAVASSCACGTSSPGMRYLQSWHVVPPVLACGPLTARTRALPRPLQEPTAPETQRRIVRYAVPPAPGTGAPRNGPTDCACPALAHDVVVAGGSGRAIAVVEAIVARGMAVVRVPAAVAAVALHLLGACKAFGARVVTPF